MILSTRKLLEIYRSDVGRMGGDGADKPPPSFDRFVMTAIIAIGLVVGVVGIIGLYRGVDDGNVGLTLLALLLAVFGVSSALGVYREFVSMKIVTGVLASATEDTAKEVVQVVLENDRNMALVRMLLSLVENLFSRTSNGS